LGFIEFVFGVALGGSQADADFKSAST